IEALLRDSVLTQQIRDRGTQLCLLQDPGDLLDRKALPLHDKTSVLVDSILSQNSPRRWSGFSRAGHHDCSASRPRRRLVACGISMPSSSFIGGVCVMGNTYTVD